MEQMRKRLMPLATNGSMMRAPDMMVESVTSSYRVTDGGTLNLMGQSCGDFNINEMGLERKAADDSTEGSGNRDVSYRCASHEMLVFNTIGWGASSTVRKAIHIPYHRIVALKKINSADRVSVQVPASISAKVLISCFVQIVLIEAHQISACDLRSKKNKCIAD
jgi:hypothetical protein